MKKFLVVMMILSSAVSANAARATGTEGGNGGDICEDRIQIIRDDIRSWIHRGGAQGLLLPEGTSSGAYGLKMLTSLAIAKVSCTTEKIFVHGSEKTCRNINSSPRSMQILCNSQRFMQTGDSDQYVLVHHEYAGLSAFEETGADGSDYRISNQISGYLEDETTKKLVVKPGGNPNVIGKLKVEFGLKNAIILNDAATSCTNYWTSTPANPLPADLLSPTAYLGRLRFKWTGSEPIEIIEIKISFRGQNLRVPSYVSSIAATQLSYLMNGVPMGTTERMIAGGSPDHPTVLDPMCPLYVGSIPVSDIEAPLSGEGTIFIFGVTVNSKGIPVEIRTKFPFHYASSPNLEAR